MFRYKQDWLFIYIVLLSCLPFFVMGGLAYLMHNDHVKREYQLENAPFKPGDKVRMVAFGHEGMVIQVRCTIDNCTYDVRFSALKSSTEYHILGSGGPIDVAPMAVVYGVREYELEKVR